MPSGKSSRGNGPRAETPTSVGAFRNSGTYETSAPQTHHDTASEGRPATNKPAKRRKNRHRKRRNRRQSFLAPEESHPAAVGSGAEAEAMIAGDQTHSRPGLPFYNLRRDMSSTSLESEALLDHRNQPMMRPRRESRLAQSFRPGSMTIPSRSTDLASRGTPSGNRAYNVGDDSDGSDGVDDHTPLIRPSPGQHNSNKSWYGTDAKASPFASRQRRASVQTTSSRCSPRGLGTSDPERDYDINNPPSIPSSPKLGGDMNYDDAVVTGADFDFALAKAIDNRNQAGGRPNDMVIDVDGRSTQPKPSTQSSPSSPHLPPHEALRRRRTVALPVEEDVCFPIEEASELAEEDARRTSREDGRRRRRTKEWPDLSVLEEWSREEKEDRNGVLRAKKISEPVLIEGRLRPQYRVWRREEDEAPYRFTYFNEEFQSTIHAQSISELVQPGGNFRELFIPDPPELEDSSDEEDFEDEHNHSDHFTESNHNGRSSVKPEEPKAADGDYNLDAAAGPKIQHPVSVISEAVSEARTSVETSPARKLSPPKPKKFGPRPTFWLDVLSPTDAEMRVIAKAFGIHALTAEDIMMQETREKVELFRSYYFVNYRTFEQDPNSDNYLEPVNMYIIVFREGILSFHFSQTPHPANVRRRIRQLMDYLILSSDWISYALIDDITDVFGPLIQSIEDEVDEIDEKIMKMHSPGRPMDSTDNNHRQAEDEEPEPPAPGEMLRRVGECRKKVMGMYRLLSNKADVVKGFAKRCNEHWEVAPKSEIGLYLGDIQDHIMTMTSSLTYYETLLSRAHSNYLAQINILMNERQEQTADVLGKLTVLGTIVLPMNIICGMWGMNVKVPGQDEDNLWWFWSITGGLIFFAFASFLIAKRVYKIV